MRGNLIEIINIVNFGCYTASKRRWQMLSINSVWYLLNRNSTLYIYSLAQNLGKSMVGGDYIVIIGYLVSYLL